MSEENEVEKENGSVGKFVGGEIHIVVDGETGAFSLNHPTNIVLALGILETAKAIMIQRNQEQQKKAEVHIAKNPTGILRADQSTLDNLKKLGAVRPS